MNADLSEGISNSTTLGAVSPASESGLRGTPRSETGSELGRRHKLTVIVPEPTETFPPNAIAVMTGVQPPAKIEQAHLRRTLLHAMLEFIAVSTPADERNIVSLPFAVAGHKMDITRFFRDLVLVWLDELPVGESQTGRWRNLESKERIAEKGVAALSTFRTEMIAPYDDGYRSAEINVPVAFAHLWELHAICARIEMAHCAMAEFEVVHRKQLELEKDIVQFSNCPAGFAERLFMFLNCVDSQLIRFCVSRAAWPRTPVGSVMPIYAVQSAVRLPGKSRKYSPCTLFKIKWPHSKEAGYSRTDLCTSIASVYHGAEDISFRVLDFACSGRVCHEMRIPLEFMMWFVLTMPIRRYRYYNNFVIRQLVCRRCKRCHWIDFMNEKVREFANRDKQTDAKIWFYTSVHIRVPLQCPSCN
jgi:hypothetical protein